MVFRKVAISWEAKSNYNYEQDYIRFFLKQI